MRNGKGGGGIGRKRDLRNCSLDDQVINTREMKRQSQKVNEGVLLILLVAQ